MKKILLFLLLFLLITPLNVQAANYLQNKLSGKILLQVEGVGQSWYVDPITKDRAFLGRPADAFRIMREFGLGISEKDYNSFKGYGPRSLSGRILLRVEAHGEAYYINPDNLKMYYLGRPDDAYNVMRELGLGIKNNDLDTIPINNKYSERVVINNQNIIVETPKYIYDEQAAKAAADAAAKAAADAAAKAQAAELERLIAEKQAEIARYEEGTRVILLINNLLSNTESQINTLSVELENIMDEYNNIAQQPYLTSVVNARQAQLLTDTNYYGKLNQYNTLIEQYNELLLAKAAIDNTVKYKTNLDYNIRAVLMSYGITTTL